jgi:hypothetical protein
MKKSVLFIALVALVFQSGCPYAGLISVIGTPTEHEKKIPAEYDLGKGFEKATVRILVLVDQPGWLQTELNLRYYLTNIIGKTLVRRIKIQPENIVSYKQLSQYRSEQEDFCFLSATEIGKAVGVDLVLLVTIEDYSLREMARTGYLRGYLHTENVLFDVSSGEKLWPKSERSKSVKVGFGAGKEGKEIGAARLAAASAHCTVRYLFNCPKTKFKIAEERGSIGWENWQ